jgi:hypothetical protein
MVVITWLKFYRKLSAFPFWPASQRLEEETVVGESYKEDVNANNASSVRSTSC